jgi:hypothetical protein
MKATLQAVQTALRDAAALDYVRDSDIHITPDVDYVPSSVRMPCIGVKDGKTVFEECVGDVTHAKFVVRLAVFQEILREEASIVGDGLSRKGILEIAADIHGVLRNNRLGLSSIVRVVRTSEAAGRLFASGNGLAVQRVLDYEYEIHQEN